MFLNALTIISFFIAIISFIIQILPMLPRYRNYITVIMWVTLGLFLGLSLGYLNSSPIQINYKTDPISLLVIMATFLYGLLGFFFSIVAVFSEKYQARAKEASSSFLWAFFGLLMLFGAGSAYSEREARNSAMIDLIRIGETMEKEGNHSFAKQVYVAARKLSSNEDISRKLDQKIGETPDPAP